MCVVTSGLTATVREEWAVDCGDDKVVDEFFCRMCVCLCVCVCVLFEHRLKRFKVVMFSGITKRCANGKNKEVNTHK